MNRLELTLVVAAALCAPALDASAQTIYKLIHKDGKVTYSESEPKNFDGKVVPMNVDPNANTVSLPKPAPATGAGAAPERNADGIRRAAKPEPGAPGLSPADRIQAAKDKLENARKALQEAKDNPGEGDLRWIGNVGGGTRAIPSESYQRRLEVLESNVRGAEEELKLAEKGD